MRYGPRRKHASKMKIAETRYSFGKQWEPLPQL